MRVCPRCYQETKRITCPDCGCRTSHVDVADFFERRDKGATIWEIKGEHNYQPTLKAIKSKLDGDRAFSARVVPEPTNEHDANAVRVTAHGASDTIGYLSRTDAKRYQRFVAAQPDLLLDGVIVGGERDRPTLGVYVDGTPYRKLYEADPKNAARLAKTAAKRTPPSVPAPKPTEAPQAKGGPDVRIVGAIIVLAVIAIWAFAIITAR